MRDLAGDTQKVSVGLYEVKIYTARGESLKGHKLSTGPKSQKAAVKAMFHSGEDTKNEKAMPRPTTQTMIDRKYNWGEENENRVYFTTIRAEQRCIS